MKNLAYRFVSLRWKPYSKLILGSDNAGWVLDWEMRELAENARRIGLQVLDSSWLHRTVRQSVFFADQFFLQDDSWLRLSHRVGFAYFHGLPGTGEPVFDKIYEAVSKHHERISRVQVSHTQMRDVILHTGIAPSKVFLIPIGINLDFFPVGTAGTKQKARNELEIPQSAFVIGSFQKDGNGWGEGLEPKLIKGPDIFLSVVERLKESIPELYVLLSGPARGYMKRGLEKLRIPYSHIFLDSYPDISKLYHTLDLYLITSRQEGGPKAVLESMASGVPVVSTPVGQAMDLIKTGHNGWLASSVDELTSLSLAIFNLDSSSLETVLANGRKTAVENSYPAQTLDWEMFMNGFVE